MIKSLFSYTCLVPCFSPTDTRGCCECQRAAVDHPEGGGRPGSLHQCFVPVQPDPLHAAARHRPAQLRLGLTSPRQLD